MLLSRRETAALRRSLALLSEDLGEREVRLGLGRALLDLLQADHFASYVWDAADGRFADGVWLHMDPANLARYERHYQFHDPITFELQKRRHAAAVSEVMPHAELARTEFFNDFLALDGLHWGINLHAFDDREAGTGRALGDLRIWRGRARREFGAQDKALLDLLEPAFIAALRRARPAPVQALSPREREVADLVARGATDKAIARELGVSVASVRTYLRRLAAKTGVQRRAALAGWLAAAER
jgi:DNA-binding CsgD family transcriptional regulator